MMRRRGFAPFVVAAGKKSGRDLRKTKHDSLLESDVGPIGFNGYRNLLLKALLATIGAHAFIKERIVGFAHLCCSIIVQER